MPVTRSTSRNVDGPPKAPVDSKRVSGGRNNKPWVKADGSCGNLRNTSYVYRSGSPPNMGKGVSLSKSPICRVRASSCKYGCRHSMLLSFVDKLNRASFTYGKKSLLELVPRTSTNCEGCQRIKNSRYEMRFPAASTPINVTKRRVVRLHFIVRSSSLLDMKCFFRQLTNQCSKLTTRSVGLLKVTFVPS